MDDIKVKTGLEIVSLVGKLNPLKRTFILNTIDALLYAQQIEQFSNITNIKKAKRRL